MDQWYSKFSRKFKTKQLRTVAIGNRGDDDCTVIVLVVAVNDDCNEGRKVMKVKL